MKIIWYKSYPWVLLILLNLLYYFEKITLINTYPGLINIRILFNAWHLDPENLEKSKENLVLLKTWWCIIFSTYLLPLKFSISVNIERMDWLWVSDHILKKVHNICIIAHLPFTTLIYLYHTPHSLTYKVRVKSSRPGLDMVPLCLLFCSWV